MLLVLVVVLGHFGIGFCKLNSKNEALESNRENNEYSLSTLPTVVLPCKNFPSCLLIDRNKGLKRSYNELQVFPAVQDFDAQQKSLIQSRSYYSNYAAPATTAYYPTFDPISVLASLAFLAFLLQSFSSLYDRSRSILPSIISARQTSSPETTMSSITKHVLRAFDEYESLNNNLIRPEGSKGLS